MGLEEVQSSGRVEEDVEVQQGRRTEPDERAREGHHPKQTKPAANEDHPLGSRETPEKTQGRFSGYGSDFARRSRCTPRPDEEEGELLSEPSRAEVRDDTKYGACIPDHLQQEIRRAWYEVQNGPGGRSPDLDGCVDRGEDRGWAEARKSFRATSRSWKSK